MQRIKEEFLNKLEGVIPLEGRTVLEIGCGDGSRSVDIARRCRQLVAIDPDASKVRAARARQIANATFSVGKAEKLEFQDELVDVVIFTLSLHHVPIAQMTTAIDEAIRVVRPTGQIIFLEPTTAGSFFEAELRFDACDGDERAEKQAAYEAMKNHDRLQEVSELDDETVFQFESLDDFTRVMTPKKHQDKIEEFLESNQYTLNAKRRINIFNLN